MKVDDLDPEKQTLNFAYPVSHSEVELEAVAYIKPVVRLEFGVLADHWPAKIYRVTPYAAEELPILSVSLLAK